MANSSLPRTRVTRFREARLLLVATGLLAASTVGCGGDEGGTAAGAPQGSDDSGVTGTVTFDGTEVQPLDRLSCVQVPGEGTLRIAGEIGDDGYLQLQADSATYEDGEVTWVTTSGDNRGSLEVTEDGASGALLLYEQGTANDLGEQEFFELTADLSC